MAVIPDPEVLAGFIRDRARELGFEHVGFSPAAPPPRAGFLLRWIQAGYHATMGWLARDPERRVDPSLLVPGARSVVVVGIEYGSPEPTSLDPARGRISRYAWGDDYHRLVKKRLFGLADAIREAFPAVSTRVAVDTAPLLEKPLAAAAGVGWLGKNACTIVRGRGSWLFLGEVVIDADLPPSTPARDHCGTCQRCLSACPTDAFVAPYVVDSARCISYLTIEHRGPIDRALRPLMGNRIFGCDDCQDVCPWNKFAVPTREAGFRPRPENLAPPLAELLSLSEEAFRERFRRSPVRRARRDGFVRNVAIAIGNSGRPELVEPLARALDDPSPLVRGHVAWALGRLGGTAARIALEDRAAIEEDTWVVEEIVDARSAC